MQSRSFGTLNNILHHSKPKHLRKKIPVALLEDVAGVGVAGEVPWVRRGMMRRNLFPFKKALYLDLEGNPIPIFDPHDFSTQALKNVLSTESSSSSSIALFPDQDPIVIAFKKAQLRAAEHAEARKVLAEKLFALPTDFTLVFERLPIQKESSSSSSPFPPMFSPEATSSLEQEPPAESGESSLSSPSLSGSSSYSSQQDARGIHGSVTTADIKELFQKDHNIILLEDGTFEQRTGIENNRVKASGIYTCT